jgi:hypothetical protein
MTTPAPVDIFTTAAYKAMTKPQQKAAVEKILKGWGGTVTPAWVKENPSLKPLQGKTAVQVFDALVTANPNATYEQAATAVLEIWVGGNLSGLVLNLAIEAGSATDATAVGVATGFPSWESGLASFLGALSSANTWIRVAKVAIGGTMLIVGISKITGLDSKAPLLAKAVKAAPLL